ncbi:MAG: NUDIX hydrolase YfcD [Desulfobacterales bacterium]|nr:NUDIX hydrolase YfcD [Desulfobacterales bacterium]
MSDNEIVLIVDEHNQVVGAEPRSAMRRMNLPHRASYILVFDRRERLFIHKRTQSKDVFPGYYDIAGGGVVKKGETYRQSAERELFEELGIRGVPLTELFDCFYSDEHCRVWGRVYRCEYNGDMTLQKEEIESGRFMAVSDILTNTDSLKITPDSLLILQRYVRMQPTTLS